MKIMRIAFKPRAKSPHLGWVQALRRPGRNTGRTAPASMQFLRPLQPLPTTSLHHHITSLNLTPHFHHSTLTQQHNRHFHHLHPTNFQFTATQPKRLSTITIREKSAPHAARHEAIHTLRRTSSTLRELTSQTRLAATTFHLQRTLTAKSAHAPQSQPPLTPPAAILIQRNSRIEETIARLSTEVARKQAAPAATPSHDSRSSAATASAHRHSSAPVESVHVAPWLKTAPPAVDIDQLTEQVIRQIDSRMIAHRERMGRY